MLAFTIAVLALAAPPPAWIQRAVPPPIVAWREADLLGTRVVEGVAVSKGGGHTFVGVVDSRPQPPQMVLDYSLVHSTSGVSVKTLRAGRITGDARGEIAVVLRTAGKQQAWILRVAGDRLRLVRRFAADEIVVSGRTVRLTWHGPRVLLEVWRYERGKYRLVATS